MNRARCTLEVYNFLRESPVAGQLFVWVSGTKGQAPRTKRPSGRLQRAGTAAGSVLSLYGPERDFREEECSLSDTAGNQRDTLPSKTPLQGQ